MGIIIGDTITLINGLSAQNTYGSFGDSILTLEKIEEITVDENNVETPSNIYTLSCKGSIWTTQDYRTASKPKIDSISIHLKLNSTQLNSNLYSLLYTQWKTLYTTVNDSTN